MSPRPCATVSDSPLRAATPLCGWLPPLDAQFSSLAAFSSRIVLSCEGQPGTAPLIDGRTDSHIHVFWATVPHRPVGVCIENRQTADLYSRLRAVSTSRLAACLTMPGVADQVPPKSFRTRNDAVPRMVPSAPNGSRVCFVNFFHCRLGVSHCACRLANEPLSGVGRGRDSLSTRRVPYGSRFRQACPVFRLCRERLACQCLGSPRPLRRVKSLLVWGASSRFGVFAQPALECSTDRRRFCLGPPLASP